MADQRTARLQGGPDIKQRIETSSTPVIRVADVCKAFGPDQEQALEMRREGMSKTEVEQSTASTVGVLGADFDVYANEVFVVIGLSGSGKSTLLRLLNRLVEPTSGDVWIDGDNVSNLTTKQLRQLRRAKTGMVFQSFGLLPNRTVMGNVTFGLEIQGVSRRERESSGQEALELVGLEGQADRRISELSGGMQQRVGLARALATKQEILLMDEPFSALDPLIRRDMQDLFLKIQGEIERTVVFITHDLNEALRLGHRVAIMNEGRIIQVGTPAQILTNPADEYVERFISDVDYAKVRSAQSVMSDVEDNVDVQTRVSHGDPLSVVLPLFVESDDPVGVTDDTGNLCGVIHRHALIQGLCSSNEEPAAEPVSTTNEAEGNA